MSVFAVLLTASSEGWVLLVLTHVLVIHGYIICMFTLYECMHIVGGATGHTATGGCS